uniref:Uncharacterized LOC100179749 n=1 Tax=Ciona intestinalis TaxID=7719 RepID=F6QZQ8_CIOIN|nr:uncharacterized protein LOC100179749 [Ciona intestinalis]|eukprot:XP_002127923.1 uncharacterized protein LOC100179749 [Ciona intestinalis]
MPRERILCVFSALGFAACAYQYTVFGLADKVRMPGAGWYEKSAAEVAKKFPLKNDPSEVMVGTAWVFTFLPNLLSTLYLLTAQRQRRIFPQVFYIVYCVNTLLTLAWTFTYERGLHLMSTMIVGSVCVLGAIQLYIGIKHFKEFHISAPEKFKWWLQRVVLNSVALTTTWSFVALPSTVSYLLIYERSNQSETAILKGLMNVDTATSIGLCLLAIGQITWTLLDFLIVPAYTSIVTSVYPVLVFGGFGLALSNFEHGFNRHNIFCLVVGIVASISMIKRKRIHENSTPKQE